MNQKILEKINSHPIFELVSTCAQRLNLPVYIVGGYVRDILLNRPSKDIDFVCIGSGISLAEEVNKELKGKSKLAVYKNFGTASIAYQDLVLEFVGARKESYRSDSRKPIVEDGTLEDDQRRRDFTINALSVSLNKSDFGKLIDPFDGVLDLENQVIRTPLDPKETFNDDPLRIMRAIRFASQLVFDIEADTFQAIIDYKDRLKIVSMERISDELNKIILSPKPSYGFNLLFHSGILQLIFPEMVKLQGVKIIEGQGHKDNFYHTLGVLDNISLHTNNLWLRWAAILHDIAKPATQRYTKESGWTFHGHEDLGAKWVPGIFKRLKLPLNEKMKYVQKLVRLHLRPIALVNEQVTDSAIRRLLSEAGDDIDDLMTLCNADITSKNQEKVKKYKNNFNEVVQKIKDVEARDHIRNFNPPITGEQIIKTFKLKPSRIVGEIKDEIKEAILDGKIKNDHSEAYNLMVEIGKSKGLEIK
ncbi:MAG: CCA tRNA nucleotidyltransferase [Bacteroidota bacterium]